MNKFEKDYRNLLHNVITSGNYEKARQGINTVFSINENLVIDLKQGFPILTGKKVFFKKAQAEYMWIREGGTTLNYLHEHGVTWWDEFAVNGTIPKTYGSQLRSFNNEVDQLEYVINEVRLGSRRAIISLWNPSDLKDQTLPCCYHSLQFIKNGPLLDLIVTFRSSDVFLGLPYDIVVFALMLIDIANFTDLIPNKIHLNLGNAHLYENHMKQALEYMSRPTHCLPTYNYETKDLIGYKYEPFIKAKLNV